MLTTYTKESTQRMRHIVGLMSDVWCGRYKVILLSVEIVWCGVLFLTLGATVAPQHSFFFIEVVAIAIVYAGKAGIEVNVVPGLLGLGVLFNCLLVVFLSVVTVPRFSMKKR